jgi:hypothetical protein
MIAVRAQEAASDQWYRKRLCLCALHRSRALLRLPHDDRRVRRLSPRHPFRIAQDRAWNEATALLEKVRD